MAAPLDDRALVTAAQSGDRGALDQLLRRHYDRVHGVCRRITGNDADAADAAQEAMIAMVRGLARFDGRASFGTWAYRIATNASLDELRRRRRRPLLAGRDQHGHERPDVRDGHERADATAGDRIEQLGDRHLLDAALLALPEDFRVPVVLRDVADLDYAEIAAVLDIPVGTVKSRIARGRGMLAHTISRADGNQHASSDRPTNASDRSGVRRRAGRVSRRVHRPDMNDDELLHLNELASAYLDGDVTADERARVESSPELQSLVATFGRLRGVLADAPVVAAGTREAAFLAAFAQLDDVAADSSPLTGGVRASVTQLDSRRRWPRVALSAAAGLLLVGVVGVAVLDGRGGDDSQSSSATEAAAADMQTDMQTGGAPEAIDAAPMSTIGSISGSAQVGAIIDTPEQLLTLQAPPMGDAAPAATEFDQPDSSSVNTLAAEQPTSLDSTVDTAAAKIDGAFARPALACLNEQQQFLADIQYQGIFAIAARDMVTGVTQAITDDCVVLASVGP